MNDFQFEAWLERYERQAMRFYEDQHNIYKEEEEQCDNKYIDDFVNEEVNERKKFIINGDL